MLTRMIYPLSLRKKITWQIQNFYSNINDQNISLEFNTDIKFDLSKNDVGHKSIIFNGFYELDLSKTLIKLGSKGGLLIDVGANYGYFSCLWATQNSKNKVFAFEASPMNINPLKNNISKNMLNDRVKIIPIALGKEKGKLNFNLEIGNQQTGWGGFSLNKSSATVEVGVDTLDSYAQSNNLPQIDVLKIDTEGADTWVLYGAKQLIKEKKINNIFFEHNPTRMKKLNIGENEAIDFLRKYNYEVIKKSPCDFHAFPSI